jgi:hypothetical protein
MILTLQTWQAIQAINGPGNSMASVASQPDAYDHTPVCTPLLRLLEMPGLSPQLEAC